PITAQTNKAIPAKEAEAKINWDGEWTLLLEDSDKLDPLIEEHVKDQNFAMKVYWKKKLQNACKLPKNLDILFGMGGFSITFDKEPPIQNANDGAASAWKRSDGEAFQVTLRQDGPRVTQTFQAEGFSLTYVYSMRKSGNTMAIQATYAHPKLSNNFSYKMVFQRN
ncbi:MAG: hypothetical protein Q8O00_07525, partial [Holophaga sp.]|nr:hypothetical protein [Holophaga sp.]